MRRKRVTNPASMMSQGLSNPTAAIMMRNTGERIYSKDMMTSATNLIDDLESSLQTMNGIASIQNAEASVTSARRTETSITMKKMAERARSAGIMGMMTWMKMMIESVIVSEGTIRTRVVKSEIAVPSEIVDTIEIDVPAKIMTLSALHDTITEATVAPKPLKSLSRSAKISR